MFGKSKPSPVDRRRVLDLVNLGMKETDAADQWRFKPQEFEQAKKRFDRAFERASKEEQRLAAEALSRHGY